MSAQLLLGKPCADDIYAKISALKTDNKRTLYAIGFSDAPWLQYTRSLAKASERCGMAFCRLELPSDCSAEEFAERLKFVCGTADALGVIVEQPLHARYRGVLAELPVTLDVDCVSPFSVAAMYSGAAGFRPATPSAVIRLLDFYGVKLQGKHVVIVGRGAVGKPLALLMLERNATVTICHSKTENLQQICKSADMLVSACGVAGLVRKEFVRPETVVVDVGLSCVNGKAVGDVCPDVGDVCSALAPVPGGVGPVTTALLLENLSRNIFGQ